MTDWTEVYPPHDTVADTTIRPFTTLDAVSLEINSICDGFIKAQREAIEAFQGQVDALGTAIDASPSLDKTAVGSMIVGRVNRMIREAAELAAL